MLTERRMLTTEMTFLIEQNKTKLSSKHLCTLNSNVLTFMIKQAL